MRLSTLDKLISSFDTNLRIITGTLTRSDRINPAISIKETKLSEQERADVAAMMRVNHTGEVCAQALYQAQALTAKSQTVKQQLQQSANEEVDHLFWCQQRLSELGSHVSYLNLLWYLGSFSMGALAGIVGDKWNLGFVEETENQVVAHLDKHLEKLPPNDKKTKIILSQMRKDEAHHAATAKEQGAATLPSVIRKTMQLTSKVMTTIAAKV